MDCFTKQLVEYIRPGRTTAMASEALSYVQQGSNSPACYQIKLLLRLQIDSSGLFHLLRSEVLLEENNSRTTHRRNFNTLCTRLHPCASLKETQVWIVSLKQKTSPFILHWGSQCALQITATPLSCSSFYLLDLHALIHLHWPKQ